MTGIASQITSFLTQVKNELRRVRWPTREEIKSLTLIVVGIMITLGLYISALDLALTKLIQLGIG